jgi:hypothetical protein
VITHENIVATWRFILRDHRSWPLRFWLEVLAWSLSIGAAFLFALTVPKIPFYLYLSMTISCCAIYTWAAWTRGSFGMLANYLALTMIDSIGFARLLAGA